MEAGCEHAGAEEVGGPQARRPLPRPPRLQVGALLAGPVGWLVVGYLGSLAILSDHQLLDAR